MFDEGVAATQPLVGGAAVGAAISAHVNATRTGLPGLPRRLDDLIEPRGGAEAHGALQTIGIGDQLRRITGPPPLDDRGGVQPGDPADRLDDLLDRGTLTGADIEDVLGHVGVQGRDRLDVGLGKVTHMHVVADAGTVDLEVLEPPAGAAGDDQGADDEDFVPEPALVMGDEARLRQVMVNLLANARVHTPAGCRVVTTLSRRGGSLLVRISDDGPGINPAVRDRLFERFARADSSRERRTGSTGLGMSIALAIVQSHGGSLTVESSTGAEDHGTAFTVSLSAADPE